MIFNDIRESSISPSSYHKRYIGSWLALPSTHIHWCFCTLFDFTSLGKPTQADMWGDSEVIGDRFWRSWSYRWSMSNPASYFHFHPRVCCRNLCVTTVTCCSIFTHITDCIPNTPSSKTTSYHNTHIYTYIRTPVVIRELFVLVIDPKSGLTGLQVPNSVWLVLLSRL